MAGFILCRSKYSNKPYHISNMAINIYSLEELCYYIFNNIYLIGTDLVDEGLIKYIGEQLGEEELAEQLRFLVSQKAGLAELVITILRYVDYYSTEEIQGIRNTIEKLDTQNAMQRLKLRADNFLNNKRYESAIHNYGLIVYAKKDSSLTDEFYGNVWHNMGVANSKLFSFGEANECFLRAYELNKNEESYKSAKTAEFMQKGFEETEESDEMMCVISKEIETLMDNAPRSMEYSEIRNALSRKKEGNINECYDILDGLVIKWKSEYRNYIK